LQCEAPGRLITCALNFSRSNAAHATTEPRSGHGQGSRRHVHVWSPLLGQLGNAQILCTRVRKCQCRTYESMTTPVLQGPCEMLDICSISATKYQPLTSVFLTDVYACRVGFCRCVYSSGLRKIPKGGGSSESIQVHPSLGRVKITLLIPPPF